MKPCRALNHLRLPSLGPQQCTKRWNSYDRSALTKEALLNKVHAGFGQDDYAAPLVIKADDKTISTAAGDLPISPLFDPAWVKARRRQTKAIPSQPTGRFRKKLANNPYAQALITPVRRCSVTSVYLPRYFFQDLELVKHPETGQGWWAPGPLAFEHVEPSLRQPTEDNIIGSAKETADQDQQEAPTVRRGRAPITSYAICRKSLMDILGKSHTKYGPALIGSRSGMAIAPQTRKAMLRSDMAEVLLGMMRQHVITGLVHRTNRAPKSVAKFLQPCANWDEAKTVSGKGSILWIPETSKGSESAYATLDSEGSFGSKIAVHDLIWLLGEEGVEKLRNEAGDVFRDNRIVVLKAWKSVSMLRLQMLLWRMQGYLANSK